MSLSSLKVNLDRDTLRILEKEETLSSLNIEIFNESEQPVKCDRVRVKIPFGIGAEALIKKNTFSIGDDFNWLEPEPENLQPNGAERVLELDFIHISSSKTIASKSTEKFQFFDLPVLGNLSGEDQREVNIVVELFADGEDALIRTTSLTLKNLPEDGLIPYVHTFVPSALSVRIKEPLKLQWSMSNVGNMKLFPKFLSDSDLGSLKARDTDKPSARQTAGPILIDSETPIEITEPVDTLEVQLITSTEFTLVADDGDNGFRGGRQLTILVKKLSVTRFDAPALDLEQAAPYGKPIQLEWDVTFTQKGHPDNKVFLLVQEKSNNKQETKPLPLSLAERAVSAQNTLATKIIELDEDTDRFEVIPFRHTTYKLELQDGEPSPFAGINQTEEPSRTVSVNIKAPNYPIGSIILFPGTKETVPPGWRLCDGGDDRDILRTDIEDSFEELARALGQAANSQKLFLPNLTNRFPKGARSSNELLIPGGPALPHSHMFERRVEKLNVLTRLIKGKASVKAVARGNVGGKRKVVTTSGTADFTVRFPNARVKLTEERSFFGAAVGETKKGSHDLNRPKYHALNFIIRVAMS